MGPTMRRIVEFECEGATLIGSLDDARGNTGLLIVSGGNEIRTGAHRGMAMLAREIADHGFPVFRFDRRGIGDSDGKNGEFRSSGPDLAAAIAAFRAETPVDRIIAFGNCDAATAILLHRSDGIDAAILANIWTIERTDSLPPPAAIKAHYLERLRDPTAWIGLVTGAINLKKLAQGLLRIAQPAAPSSLPQQLADAMAAFPAPFTLLLAERDPTAIAFLAEWRKPAFDRARNRPDVKLRKLNSESHSFAGAADHAVLVETLLGTLA
jgi:exosortase A-associated hydrolase 1